MEVYIIYAMGGVAISVLFRDRHFADAMAAAILWGISIAVLST